MTLEELFKVVEARAKASPDDSWTAKLLSKGPEKCVEKFGEEAVESSETKQNRFDQRERGCIISFLRAVKIAKHHFVGCYGRIGVSAF